jgi:hypothetical protein
MDWIQILNGVVEGEEEGRTCKKSWTASCNNYMFMSVHYQLNKWIQEFRARWNAFNVCNMDTKTSNLSPNRDPLTYFLVCLRPYNKHNMSTESCMGLVANCGKNINQMSPHFYLFWIIYSALWKSFYLWNILRDAERKTSRRLNTKITATIMYIWWQKIQESSTKEVFKHRCFPSI